MISVALFLQQVLTWVFGEQPKRVTGRRASLGMDERMLTGETVESVLAEFFLDTAALRSFIAEMNGAMDAGLRGGLAQSSMAMLPSYVPELPDGTEQGRFLAIDLGGTNIRFLLLELQPGTPNRLISHNSRFPTAAMTGTAEQLFDCIASRLHDFLVAQNLNTTTLPVGFTFSYPCEQDALDSSVLLRWTKGFTATGVIGENVVRLMREAIDRKGGMKVKVVAIMNDTVGTLVAAAADHRHCLLGAIIGIGIATGTNCAYMEDVAKIVKCRGNPDVQKHDQMVINSEWGAFMDRGEAAYVKTRFDEIVNERSVHPGNYTLDKLIAGFYMGELVRLVLERLVAARLLFDGEGSEALSTPMNFPTKYISEILSDDIMSTREVLAELGIASRSYTDLLVVREVCIAVSRRSANLAAAAMTCIINRLRPTRATIGVDGTTYWSHPSYNSWVRNKIHQLLSHDCDLVMVQVGDGSGRGAALVAAIADKLGRRKGGRD